MRERFKLKENPVIRKLIHHQIVLPSGHSSRIIFSILVAGYNFLFLFYFRPFKFETTEAIRVWFSAGYALITLLSLLFSFFILPLFFRKLQEQNRLKVPEFGAFGIFILLLITVLSWTYTRTLGQDIIYSYSLINCFGFVFLIAFLPFLMVVLVSEIFIRNETEKNRNKKARLIPESTLPKEETASETITILADQGNFTLSFDPKDFILGLSDQNYCKLFILYGGEKRSLHMRISLKSLSEQLSALNFIRCHKTALINPDYIDRIEGNSKNRLIYLKYMLDQPIPVSRNFDLSLLPEKIKSA